MLQSCMNRDCACHPLSITPRRLPSQCYIGPFFLACSLVQSKSLAWQSSLVACKVAGAEFPLMGLVNTSASASVGQEP